jgi:hypothetical protein
MLNFSTSVYRLSVDMRQASKNDTALHRSVTRKIRQYMPVCCLSRFPMYSYRHDIRRMRARHWPSYHDWTFPSPSQFVTIFFIVFVEFMGKMWAWKSNVILCIRAIVFWSGNHVKLLILYPMKRVFTPGLTAFSPTHGSNIGEFTSRSTVTRLNKSHS